jgi:putative FmdB family regulatory protein
MPAYDYECATCGVFTEFRRMDEFMLPAACPHCATESPRLLISSPSLTGLRPPRWMKQGIGPRSSENRVHFGGCGCCGPSPSHALRAASVAALPTGE